MIIGVNEKSQRKTGLELSKVTRNILLLICILLGLAYIMRSTCFHRSDGYIQSSIQINEKQEKLGDSMTQPNMAEVTDLHFHDDSPNLHNKKEDPKKRRDNKKGNSLLKLPWIRFLIAFGVFVALNMLVICIHHIYQKLSSSEKSYRSIELNISPF
ncbi:uncharacterized protein PRCAT00000437001 [Priceomyces carsonii]|uniref:uncharacterized protein n=1 Tax=Priceomyces carsonii TaxID=28549 RepID=UPI002EDA58CC|nr:unnamed protein product [Priceomyces carsonii]